MTDRLPRARRRARPGRVLAARTSLPVLLVLAWLPQLRAQGAYQRKVDRLLAEAPATQELRAWRPHLERLLALRGDLRAHLTERGDEAVPARALRALNQLEGRDLRQGALPCERVPLRPSPLYLSENEILLIRCGEEMRALQVLPRDPGSKTLKGRIWTGLPPNRRLPGLRHAEEFEVDGEIPPDFPPEARRGFADPRLFVVPVGDVKVPLFAQGLSAYRVILPRGAAGDKRRPRMHASGESRPARVKPRKLPEASTWPATLDPERDRRLRRIQLYLFRLLAVEPLPTFDTEDEGRFGYAEAVQPLTRRLPSGEEVLIAALHTQDGSPPAYGPFEHAHFLAFAGALGFEPANVLVHVGGRGRREAQLFFEKGTFQRPGRQLRERLRQLFPEEG